MKAVAAERDGHVCAGSERQKLDKVTIVTNVVRRTRMIHLHVQQARSL